MSDKTSFLVAEVLEDYFASAILMFTCLSSERRASPLIESRTMLRNLIEVVGPSSFSSASGMPIRENASSRWWRLLLHSEADWAIVKKIIKVVHDVLDGVVVVQDPAEGISKAVKDEGHRAKAEGEHAIELKLALPSRTKKGPVGGRNGTNAKGRLDVYFGKVTAWALRAMITSAPVSTVMYRREKSSTGMPSLTLYL